MRLVVDASVLIGELLRASGRARLADERIELFFPEQVWGEAQHELPRRVAAFARRRKISDADGLQLVRHCLKAIETNVVLIEEAVYLPLEDEARSRSLRDPNDWPLVACALILGSGIWTADRDLFGVGVATWTTETLARWLERNPEG